MQKIVPFLWFDGYGEEAVAFYTSVFKDAITVHINRYGAGGPMPAGTMTSATFRLFGQEFYALNGGPYFQFSPAVSFFIKCDNQAEVDYYWERLTDGGVPQPCGWLKDRFGLSWQVIPNRLGELLGDTDPRRAQRAMAAMMGMQKIDVAQLEAAADGE
jgi:predicted 3-demethylubiquinone-9 3-methyltransferase (glyoxalase superfamily)